MGQLAPNKATGEYDRPESTFLKRLGSKAHPVERDRYRLYVGLSCPWAHRTLITRVLKGLENAIDVVVLKASVKAGGWAFEPPHEGCSTFKQFYRQAHPQYQGRTTVPVLWDKQSRAIVNNESAQIIETLNADCNELADHPALDLYPPALRSEIDAWNTKIYHQVNNGVYRCGFAQSQTAYEEAAIALFETLDELDAHLAQQRYLCPGQITLADVRLFPTLVRFDSVYHHLFRCDRRRLVDYANLWGYVRDIYQLPGIADTCDLEQIRRDYYETLFPINPGGIVPLGPDLTLLEEPSDRDRLN